ncbi:MULTISPECIES: autoinducer binding domain-containing protein [unclassified Pseudomonas]|jgi:DNA-binding CsgD family transcriptional regulator|uniref:autoinducer binding domain-containing protein n=1 Tax=unclassified Pseudomonas TaxID=196821 RepID=UPI0010541D51|nr:MULTISPECIES: autoinducer binding domain-containing protein [unclassified Pseudomonas]MBW3507123.1 autoinducer binding domain-containing protein [Pseudomonas sp. NKUCC02_KPG]MEC4169597.1 autoinducer binding domain-containing protein [Pseudomonas sp. MS-1(2024)]
MTAHHLINQNQHFACRSEAELGSDTLKRIEEYGFNYFFFRTIPRHGNVITNSKVLTNYPNDYVERYEKGPLTQKNPLMTHCQLSILPIIWSADVFRDAPDQWKATQTCGLTYGWSQSVHDPNGAVSMLSLARKDPPVSQDEFSGKAASVLWLCNQLHSAMLERFHLRHRLTINIMRLSERELEVLKWTAEGKIASDIAMILSLSTRTVNFHISGAMKKLGASNKTSAVVMAARFGLL